MSPSRLGSGLVRQHNTSDKLSWLLRLVTTHHVSRVIVMDNTSRDTSNKLPESFKIDYWEWGIHWKSLPSISVLWFCEELYVHVDTMNSRLRESIIDHGIAKWISIVDWLRHCRRSLGSADLINAHSFPEAKTHFTKYIVQKVCQCNRFLLSFG